MPLFEFNGMRPRVHPSAYVHPSAVVIGDVTIGARCYIGPHASLRGDFGAIVVDDGGKGLCGWRFAVVHAGHDVRAGSIA